MVDYVALAEAAVAKHPDSDIEVALTFMSDVLPKFCAQDSDRLIKCGRQISSLVAMKDNIQLKESLELIVQECDLLSTPGAINVPKVRFGKTELMMPIVSLGSMRFQQKWGPTIQNMNSVGGDCHDNLVAILKRAVLDFGINHIETARGYGCSEIQLGVALKQLYASSKVKREDLIIQSKINSSADPKEFRANMEKTFASLQVDYLDLFSVHGFNEHWNFEWVFEGDDNCWKVIEEYVAKGKIRHVGFSTHGPADVITKAIETGKFEYANIHHHFCGSYTASGDGKNGTGNLENLRLMKERDMGVFVISAFDKGGKLYAPSRKLRSLTLPDLEPVAYGAGWLWNHHEMEPGNAPVHTFSLGAARAADLDQAAVAAHFQGLNNLLPKVKAVTERLETAKVEALGKDWVDNCFQGLCKGIKSKYGVEHNQMVWIYNIIQSWGMLGFARDRYKTFDNNRKKWDFSKTVDENIKENIGRNPWGYMPGVAIDLDKDYFVDDLKDVPEENRERIRAAYKFVVDWCHNEGKDAPECPQEWTTSYELKTWADFPDRPNTVYP